jgi:hypothetical protein
MYSNAIGVQGLAAADAELATLQLDQLRFRTHKDVGTHAS